MENLGKAAIVALLRRAAPLLIVAVVGALVVAVEPLAPGIQDKLCASWLSNDPAAQLWTPPNW